MKNLNGKLNNSNVFLVNPFLNLKNLKNRNIDPIERHQRSGVYVILFATVDGTLQFYILITNGKFKAKMKKRTAYIIYNKNLKVLGKLHNTQTCQISLKTSKKMHPSSLYPLSNIGSFSQ